MYSTNLGFNLISILLIQVVSASATPMKEISLVGRSIDFVAPTNRDFITIHGSSNEINGQLKLFENGDSILLENINIQIPIKSLKTGMSLRDNHMHEKIFKTSKGTMPDIVFNSEKVVCKNTKECDVEGNLTINEKPNKITIRVSIDKKDEGGYSAKGEMKVMLKDYDITPPEQFGVQVQNEVKISIDLVGATKLHQATTN